MRMWSDLGADGCDDASAVLPPPRDHSGPARDELWHTATFAAITDRPAARRRLRAGLALLGLTSVVVCGYAGVQLAMLAGLTPPSPPRYVIPDRGNGAGLVSVSTARHRPSDQSITH